MECMIKWCNENQGFFSALLCTLTILTSILTIFFTWKVGTLPYKKKLTVMAGYWGSDEDGHNLRISIVNVGRIPVYIRSVEVESYKGDLLGNMATMDLDKNFLIINPNELSLGSDPLTTFLQNVDLLRTCALGVHYI